MTAKAKKFLNILKSATIGIILIASILFFGLIGFCIAFYALIYVPGVNIFAYGLDIMGWLAAPDKANYTFEAVETMQAAMDPLAQGINWIYGKLFAFIKLPFTIYQGITGFLMNHFGTPVFTGLWAILLVFVLYAVQFVIVRTLIIMYKNRNKN